MARASMFLIEVRASQQSPMQHLLAKNTPLGMGVVQQGSGGLTNGTGTGL